MGADVDAGASLEGRHLNLRVVGADVDAGAFSFSTDSATACSSAEQSALSSVLAGISQNKLER